MKKTIALVACVFTAAMSMGQTKSFLDMPYVEVNGFADTLVTPNEIFIRILLSEADLKNKVSLEQQERKLVTGLKSMGIDIEQQLTTTDMQSDFKRYVLKQKDILKSKEYLLKVSDAQTATKVFIKLEEQGLANASVESVNHSEKDQLKNACRSNAVRNAQQKARALTSAVGAGVGAPLHIMDYSNDDGGMQPRIMIRGTATTDTMQDALPQIDFEKIRISVSVNVKFQIK
jgi:uncharacterized protein YggE